MLSTQSTSPELLLFGFFFYLASIGFSYWGGYRDGIFVEKLNAMREQRKAEK